MSNYYAVELNRINKVMERDAFELSFIIYDANHNILTNTQLQNFKWKFILDNGAWEVKKSDANYSDGGIDQITVSENKVIVYIDTDDTEDYYNDTWNGFLKITHKTSGKSYTIWSGAIDLFEEFFDD